MVAWETNPRTFAIPAADGSSAGPIPAGPISEANGRNPPIEPVSWSSVTREAGLLVLTSGLLPDVPHLFAGRWYNGGVKPRQL
jgi:hypothetical protein